MTSDIPYFSPMNSWHVDGKVTRFDVVRCAQSWLDTPYKHQHRAKGIGVDCAGLVIGVARELGIVAPDFDINGYERIPDGVTMLSECDRWMKRIQIGDLRPGNVLVLRFGNRPGAKPQHMGIVGDYMVGGLSLIQALGTTDGKGKVVETNLGRQFLKPVQAYELPGIFEPAA